MLDKPTARGGDRIVRGQNLAIELAVAQEFQQRRELPAGAHAAANEVVACHQRRRIEFFDGLREDRTTPASSAGRMAASSARSSSRPS